MQVFIVTPEQGHTRATLSSGASECPHAARYFGPAGYANVPLDRVLGEQHRPSVESTVKAPSATLSEAVRVKLRDCQ